MEKVNIKLWFDRLISGGSLRQIFTLLIAVVGIFFLVGGAIVLICSSNIGFTKGVEQEHFWQLYYYFVDPGNQMSMNGNNNGSRTIGFIMSTLGSIFLGGLLISTITNTLSRRVDEFKNGTSYYKFNGHTVIIGSDQMLSGIINQSLEVDTSNYIVVMTSANIEDTRALILASLKDKSQRNRIVVNYGARDSKEDLKKVGITRAKEVYILGDGSEFDEIENYHDSLNIWCLNIIAELCKEDGRRDLPCNVAFDYKTTYYVFQYADLPQEISEFVKFHPFNFCEFWAQKVLVANYSPEDNISYKPLDYRPIKSIDSDDYVHLIVIGFSKMGQAIALLAAHIAHYPNYRKRKTRITVIDSNMLKEMHKFKQKCGELFELSHSTYIDADKWVQTGEKYEEETHLNTNDYGHLVENYEDTDFIDVEWTFIKGDDCNPKVRELLHEYATDRNAIITVAVCLNITHVSLRSAMHLPKLYYENEIPILVQQRKTASMVNILRDNSQLYGNIRPFGMVYDSYDIHLAMSISYSKLINAVYDYYFTNRSYPTSIDVKNAEKIWDRLGMTNKWSNVYAAATIPTKLRCIGYDTELIRSGKMKVEPLTESQIQILAEIEHNRWNLEKLLIGYRPVQANEDLEIDRDKSKKSYYKNMYIHYDIRPYDLLKTDKSGETASVYDKMIVRCIPLIVEENNKAVNNTK